MAYNNAKTEHAFRTFASVLRSGTVAPVIFMYGKEEYLIQWAVEQLALKYVSSAAREMDYIRPDSDNITIEDVLSDCETFSMFSDKRIIWLRDFPPLSKDNVKGFGESQLESIGNYIDRPNPGTILIFSSSQVINDPKDKKEKKSKLDKLLLKKAECYDFCPLDRRSLKAFIDKRLRASGVSISGYDMDYLIDYTGYFHKDSEYRLMNLVNDLEKISGLAYATGTDGAGTGMVPNVEREDIDRAILGDMDTYVFDFLDNVTSNRKEEAFIILNNMLNSGSDIFGILSLLVNQFELMTEVRELMDEGMDINALSKELGVHEFRVKKAMTSAGRMSISKLRSILIQLYEIDTGIKQGDLDGTVALELLIGRI